MRASCNLYSYEYVSGFRAAKQAGCSPCSRTTQKKCRIRFRPLVKFDDLPPRERALAPELGEDTECIYGRLGLTSDEIAALREEGVI